MQGVFSHRARGLTHFQLLHQWCGRETRTVEDFTGENACGAEPVAKIKRWRETLPGGASYETLDCIDNVYVVPPGHFFMLGDHRDNSTDSRVLSAMGYIPLDNIIGRIEMVYFSEAPDRDGGVARVRSERVGLMIR